MKNIFAGLSYLWLGLVMGFYLSGAIHDGSIVIPTWMQSSIVSAKHPGSWVVIVEESSQRSPATARILASGFMDTLKSRQLNSRVYDVDDTGLAATIRAEAERVGLPALVIVDPVGKKMWSGAQPPTADSIDVIVRRETGL